MVNFYVRQIKKGKITLDDVPLKWRDEVQRMLDEDNQ